MKNRSNGTFIIVMVVLGILELLNVLLLRYMCGVTQVIKIILFIMAVVLIFLAGRISKASHGHPSGWGALLGAIFGLFVGMKGFFIHVTPEQLQSKVQVKKSVEIANSYHVTLDKVQGQIPPELLKKAVEIANSPIMHMVTLTLTVVICTVVGLIIALIGGATARKKD